MKLHGGKILVESMEDEGSGIQFILLLPCYQLCLTEVDATAMGSLRQLGNRILWNKIAPLKFIQSSQSNSVSNEEVSISKNGCTQTEVKPDLEALLPSVNPCGIVVLGEETHVMEFTAPDSQRTSRSTPPSIVALLPHQAQIEPNSAKKQDKFLRILVVDDSKLNRKVLVKLMESLGHLCLEAVDGQEGVEAVRAAMSAGFPFDCILMDNQMPVLLGSQATRIIRGELKYKGIIFGVTGYVFLSLKNLA
jgi:CheY-like chemotaxis protein